MGSLDLLMLTNRPFGLLNAAASADLKGTWMRLQTTDWYWNIDQTSTLSTGVCQNSYIDAAIVMVPYKVSQLQVGPISCWLQGCNSHIKLRVVL